MPRETLSDIPAPRSAGGGGPKKRDTAPPPPPPPPPPPTPMDVAEAEQSQAPSTRERMATAEQRAWDRMVSRGATAAGLANAVRLPFAAPATVGLSALAGPSEDRSEMVGKAINDVVHTATGTQLNNVGAAVAVLPHSAQKRVASALRYLLSERPGYDIQQALPSMLNLGPPKSAIVANIDGSPTVAYPGEPEVPSSWQLEDPVAFRTKVDSLKQQLREADKDRETLKLDYDKAYRAEDTSEPKLRAMSRDYEAALRSVATLRQSLREFGLKDEDIDTVK